MSAVSSDVLVADAPSECARRISMLATVLPAGARLRLVSQLFPDDPQEFEVVLLGDPTWGGPRPVDMVVGSGWLREFSRRVLEAEWLDVLVIVAAFVVNVPLGQMVDDR